MIQFVTLSKNEKFKKSVENKSMIKDIDLLPSYYFYYIERICVSDKYSEIILMVTTGQL